MHLIVYMHVCSRFLYMCTCRVDVLSYCVCVWVSLRESMSTCASTITRSNYWFTTPYYESFDSHNCRSIISPWSNLLILQPQETAYDRDMYVMKEIYMHIKHDRGWRVCVAHRAQPHRRIFNCCTHTITAHTAVSPDQLHYAHVYA